MREETALKNLEDWRAQNEIIEQVIQRIMEEDPKFDIILSRLMSW